MTSIVCPSRIVIATCARNIAQHINALTRLYSSVRSLASDVRLLVVESDSCDGTQRLLAQLADREDTIEVYSLGDLRHQIDARTARIAYCRNVYLQRAQELLAGCPDSLLIVFDSDGLLDRHFVAHAGIHLQRTLQKLADKSWISCSGVTVPFYYDVFALRAENWSPDDCWRAAERLEVEFGYEPELAYRLAVRARQICVSGVSELIQVDSAFNGLCIYKSDMINDVKYSGLTPEGRAVCEHVPLHFQQSRLHPGGSHYIDPQLVIGCTPHSYRSRSHTVEAYWYVANLLHQFRLASSHRISLARVKAARLLKLLACSRLVFSRR